MENEIKVGDWIRDREVHIPSVLRDKINELIKAINSIRKEKE